MMTKLVCFEKEPAIPPEMYVRVDADSLRRFVKECFVKVGVPENDAEIVAEVLVMADLMGISSHGVQRIRRYIDGIRKCSVNPRPKIKIVVDYHAITVLDGDQGLGQVVGVKAVDLAVEKALRYGISLILVRNSNHFGIAGYYSLKIAERGLIGITISNSVPLVAYTNTIVRNIGTNPLAVAIPRRNPPPVLFDCATSIVPVGKIEFYARIGKPIPQGWAIDEKGDYLYGDPKHVLSKIRRGEGALLPLGGLGELFGGHKGAGLALVIDIIAGVLAGAAWGPHVGYTVSDKPPNVGHAFSAINIDVVTDRDKFFETVDRYIEELKKSPKHPQADNIWIPGEKAWKTMECRLKIGIPLHKNVFEDLKKLSEELGVPFDIEIKFLSSEQPQ